MAIECFFVNNIITDIGMPLRTVCFFLLVVSRYFGEVSTTNIFTLGNRLKVLRVYTRRVSTKVI